MCCRAAACGACRGSGIHRPVAPPGNFPQPPCRVVAALCGLVFSRRRLATPCRARKRPPVPCACRTIAPGCFPQPPCRVVAALCDLVLSRRRLAAPAAPTSGPPACCTCKQRPSPIAPAAAGRLFPAALSGRRGVVRPSVVAPPPGSAVPRPQATPPSRMQRRGAAPPPFHGRAPRKRGIILRVQAGARLKSSSKRIMSSSPR